MRDNPDQSKQFHDQFRACTIKQHVGNKDVPYTLMQHENPTDPTTVCFVPGLGISYGAYEKSLETLHSTGRSLCAFGYIEARLHVPLRAQEWIDKRFVKEEHVQRALGLITMIESVEGIKRPVDVVAHSMGALYAVLAATLRPELFRRLELYAPAGFIQEDNALRIASESGNIGTIMRNQLLQLHGGHEGAHARSFLARASSDWSTYFAEHLFNLHAQMRDVSRMYIAPLARELIEKGIYVSVEVGEHDTMFPPALLIPALEKEEIPYQVLSGADHHSIGTEERVMRSVSKKLSKAM